MKLEMEIIGIEVSPEYYDPENFTWTEKGRLCSAESMVRARALPVVERTK